MTIGVALHPCRRRQKKIGQRRGDGDVILETEVNMLQPQGNVSSHTELEEEELSPADTWNSSRLC